MTEEANNMDEMEDEDKALVEEFAMGGIKAAIEFADLHDLKPSTMIVAINSIFWTYLLMISTREGASSNIDNALKYLNFSADEARSRAVQREWAEKITHNETGNA
jgi:spermidine/putrescine-binding protein